jgi:hypothetical protein
MERCPEMEKEKLWEFSIEKSKWMCVKFSRTEEVESIDVEVKQGKISKATEYKYLGNWTNEKGNLDTQLTHMEKKGKDIVRIGNNICSRDKLGRMEIPAKLFIYEKVAVLSVFYNIEVWSNLRQQDYDKLEVIQGKMLKGLLGLPKSTPYWGILHELNILPVHLRLTYKKLMIYHMLMNSPESRIARKIVEAQEESDLDNCWFHDVKTEGERIGLVVEKSEVVDVPKSAWKKTVKNKIQNEFQSECKAKIGKMTKLRFLKKSSANDTYLKKLTNDDARDAIKIRLNMMDIITQNFVNGTSCILCGDENDSTEHIFECSSLGNHGLEIEDLINGTKMMEVVELFRRMEKLRRDVLIDNIITNYNIFHREELMMGA